MAPTVSLQTKPTLNSTLGRTLFKSSANKPPAYADAAPRKSSRRPASGDASSRVQTDVLLAIKPVHLDNIISRRKNHEYRKYRLRDGVERLWLYETRGDKGGKGSAAITHIATVPANIRRTPGTVPEKPFGIGNLEFNADTKQSKYGYPILELYQLATPVTLSEMKTTWGMGGAPMGWSYVKTPMWKDRWGDKRGAMIRSKRSSDLTTCSVALSSCYLSV